MVFTMMKIQVTVFWIETSLHDIATQKPWLE